jgi:hypothetical protein
MKGAYTVNPTAIELALINFFIVVLIILDGITKIESKKSDYFDPV